MVSICANGAGSPTVIVGLRATIRYDLVGGVWMLETATGVKYELLGEMAEALQVDGLDVSFAGVLRRDMASVYGIGPVLELTAVVVR
jgi:hypothetical protein